MSGSEGFFSFTGTLTRVKVSEDGKMVNLIFPHMKFNYDLNKEVEEAISIMVQKEHLIHVTEYRAYEGKVVTVPCRPMVSKAKGTLFYMTSGDGRLMVD